jgi:hypothetical protein
LEQLIAAVKRGCERAASYDAAASCYTSPAFGADFVVVAPVGDGDRTSSRKVKCTQEPKDVRKMTPKKSTKNKQSSVIEPEYCWARPAPKKMAQRPREKRVGASKCFQSSADDFPILSSRNCSRVDTDAHYSLKKTLGRQNMNKRQTQKSSSSSDQHPLRIRRMKSHTSMSDTRNQLKEDIFGAQKKIRHSHSLTTIVEHPSSTLPAENSPYDDKCDRNWSNFVVQDAVMAPGISTTECPATVDGFPSLYGPAKDVPKKVLVSPRKTAGAKRTKIKKR